MLLSTANANCQIQNLQGKFLQYYSVNALTLIPDLFADRLDSMLDLPALSTGIKGLCNIRSQLAILQDRRRAEPQCGEFHLLHSPSCVVNEDLAQAKASWDTYSYHWTMAGAGCEVELVVTRFDATLVNVDGVWQYLSLTWREMQSLLPWVSPVVARGTDIWPADFGPTTSSLDIDATDWLNIRNVQNAEALNLMGSHQLAISLQAAPVIVAGLEENTAEGWWLVQTIHLEKDEERPITAGWQVFSRLGLTHRRFVKHTGQWQIATSDLVQLVDFSLGDYPGNRRYHRLQPDIEACLQVNVPIRCGSPDDCQVIENLFSEWFSNLRCGKLDHYVTEHMYNDQVPFKMHIRSFGPSTPCLTTQEAISSKLRSMDALHVFKQTSHHCAVAPIISIDPSGQHAVAFWIDNNLTNLGFVQDGSNDLADYMSFIALYRHDFEKIDGVWKHVIFEWDPLLSLPDRQYSQQRSRGWAGSDSCDAYPLPAHLLS